MFACERGEMPGRRSDAENKYIPRANVHDQSMASDPAMAADGRAAVTKAWRLAGDGRSAVRSSQRSTPPRLPRWRRHTILRCVTGIPAGERRASWLPMVVIAMGQAQMSLNINALPVSIGGIVAEFNTPATTVGTAIVAYSLAVAGFAMLGAKLGQKFGSLKVFRVAIGDAARGDGADDVQPQRGGHDRRAGPGRPGGGGDRARRWSC